MTLPMLDIILLTTPLWYLVYMLSKLTKDIKGIRIDVNDLKNKVNTQADTL